MDAVRGFVTILRARGPRIRSQCLSSGPFNIGAIWDPGDFAAGAIQRNKLFRIEHVCSRMDPGGSERRREPLFCYLGVPRCPESENDAEAEAVMGIWLLGWSVSTG